MNIRRIIEGSNPSVCKFPHIHIIIILFFILTTPHLTLSNDCDFSHLAQDIPLLSEYSFDVTEQAKKNEKYWNLLETALPNIQRAFISKDPYFAVLVGWGKSLDSFRKFNRKQVEDYLSQYAETGKSRAQRNQGEFKYTLSSDDPLTMYVTLTYIDGGYPYKDIGIDIVATPKCIVSLKVSGRTDELNQQYWDVFEDQFELVRDTIKEKYGLVQFSEHGRKIWWSVLINHLFWVFIIIVSALSISRLYIKKVSFVPNPTTRKYSIFIMVMAVVCIVISILIRDQVGLSDQYRFEYIPHYVFIFLVHLWAFFSNKPKIVAFALWLMVIALYSNVVFWILGWSAFKIGKLIGVVFGTALVAYTFVSAGLTKRGVQNKESLNTLECPFCNFACNLEDFDSDKLLCPNCGSHLNLEKRPL